MGSALRSDFLKSTTLGVKWGLDGHFRSPIVRGAGLSASTSKTKAKSTDISMPNEHVLKRLAHDPSLSTNPFPEITSIDLFRH